MSCRLNLSDIPLTNSFAVYYIRDADKLERTARWIERLPGGLKGLKEVIIDDKLGICSELEREMEQFVDSYFCEWTDTVQNADRRKMFKQFANTTDTQEVSEKIHERGQARPADWDDLQGPLKFSRKDVMASAEWKWREICDYTELDPHESAPTSMVIKYGDVQIAVWNLPGKGLRASQNMCPHRRAFVLADGLIGENEAGKPYISCPLHKRNYDLAADSSGEEGGKCNDADYQIMTFDAKLSEDGKKVMLHLPDQDSLDAVLSTTKWMIRKAQQEGEMLSGGGNIEISGPTRDVMDVNASMGGKATGKAVASCGGGDGELEW